MIPLIVLMLPLLSALIILLLHRSLGGASALISIGSSLICLVASIALLGSPDKTYPLFTFIHFSDALNFNIGALINQQSKGMLFVVTFVGFLVHLYSHGYMKDDAARPRYFGSLSMFMFSMTGIVLADNLAMMFIFWELVGLSSYLLIGHWFQKPSACNAANKAFMTNRIGDFGFMIGILLLFSMNAGDLSFEGLKSSFTNGGGAADWPVKHVRDAYPWMITAAALCIFMGAVGKSAQVPLHVWLPDAMEGPTPVSALIHAATMVAAGVYMLVRCSFLIAASPFAGDVITAVGAVTALLAALMATQQNDIKRILAYSTLSQLGYMIMAVGMGANAEGMFHLYTHAFFKALLFLGSGSVIHATHHNQEMDKLGGLWKKMPITGTTFFIGSLALAGIPPLAGFWSKDEILVTLDKSWGAWALLLLGFAAVMTAFYTTRLFIRTFMGKPMDQDVYDHTHESGFVMTGPLIFLALLAIFSGFIIFHDVGTALGFPGGITEFIFLPEEGPHKYHIDWAFAAASLGIGIVGVFAGAFMYWGNRKDRSTQLATWNPGLYQLIKNKFYFDDLYQAGIDRGVLGFSYIVSWFDRYVVNDTGIDGSAQVTGFSGGVLKHLQTGRVPNYAMAIALGVVGLAIAGLVVRG